MTADRYNKIRRILFSTVHDKSKGFSCAMGYLEGYKQALGHLGYSGLKAELGFYQRYHKDFSLTVACDVGEHADFSGVYDSEATRFDVTTNLKFKDFEDYEPYMGDGLRYKIALLDKDNYEVIDVLNLAFRLCDLCGGYIIPSIVLLDQNINAHGDALWSNDQVLIEVCAKCYSYEEKDRYTHHGMLSLQEHSEGFLDHEDQDFVAQSKEQYHLDAYKYFRREYSDYLMAIGQHGYSVTDPNTGGGDWVISFSFINKAVLGDMPKIINSSHEI